jgi:integrase
MTPTPGLTRARDLAMAAETIAGSLARTPTRRTLTLARLDADALSAADVAQVLHYAEAAAAANTRVAYDADWRAFVAWCAERDATPLPCPPGLLCAYLSSLAKTGLRPSTIGRRASGISHVHRQHGFEPPTNAEAVKQVLRGIRRELGTARQTKTPATHDLITAMMAACPADKLIGIRDRALLALGFAGAFRRSELVALDVADLAEVADGLRVTIRRSKTDQEGAGQEVAIPRGHHIRPVETLQAWLAAAAPRGRCSGR